MADSKNIWDKFNKSFDVEALAKDVEEAAENGGNYKEVPYDTYEVAITKLELVESKKGDPMLTCWMKIVDGEYKNSMIFMNQVISQHLPLKKQAFQRNKINKFLRALVAEMKEPIDVHFEEFNQYHDMIMDVAEAIDNNFEYCVKYYDDKGYNAFEVLEVYPLED